MTAGASFIHAACRTFSAPSTTSATSRQAHRRAVAVGDDQRRGTPRLDSSWSLASMREALLRPVEAALGLVDVGGGDRGAHVLEVEAVARRAPSGLAWMRTAGRWPPLMLTRPTPGSCEIFCARRVSARSSTCGSGSVSRGERQRQDRRVGRVDLAVDRAASAGRAAGRCAAALIAACTSCSATSMRQLEAELQRDDRAPPELVDVIWFKPGHLAELPLERRRDRRRHHVGARARIERDDLDRRVVDLRQRRRPAAAR